MDFYFENKGTNTYLVYVVKPEDTIDTLSLGMLTNNKITGLAQTQFMQMDTDKFIKYNISAHISVKQFFEGAVNRKRLVGVFKGIVNALISAEDYMIDTNSILIDLNYMFADVSTCETVLICRPIVEEVQKEKDLGAFFKNIMFSTQFDQTENCDYVAKIINYLNSAVQFSLNDFKNVLDSIDAREIPKAESLPKQPIVTKPVVTEREVFPQEIQPAVQQQVNVSTVQAKPMMPSQKAVQMERKQNSPNATKVQTPPAPLGMAVPGQKTEASSASVSSGEKEISWFYLMQHYNKENAMAYKAQKEAKKAAKGKTVATVQTPQKQVSQSPQKGVGFAIPGQEVPVKQPVAPAAASQNQPVYNNVAQPAYTPKAVQTGQSLNFGETTVLMGNGIGETTVLNASQVPAQMIAPHLIRKKTNEKISINKPVYRIGKERSYVDYFIGDNTAISRSHANIITREGTYFVVDTNSTNHTFVNDNMINSNEEIQINHGDTIRLGNEEFDFKLY